MVNSGDPRELLNWVWRFHRPHKSSLATPWRILRTSVANSCAHVIIKIEPFSDKCQLPRHKSTNLKVYPVVGKRVQKFQKQARQDLLVPSRICRAWKLKSSSEEQKLATEVRRILHRVSRLSSWGLRVAKLELRVPWGRQSRFMRSVVSPKSVCEVDGVTRIDLWFPLDRPKRFMRDSIKKEEFRSE